MKSIFRTGSIVLAVVVIAGLALSASVCAVAAGPRIADRFWDGGRQIDVIVVPGRPPAHYRAPVAPTPAGARAKTVTILSGVPAFDWCYGCSATSAAMASGYYDRGSYGNMYAGPANGGVCPLTNTTWGAGECPLSATHQGYDGLGVKGHVDDYWVSYGSTAADPWIGNWTQHTYANCTGDYMGTNQSSLSNTDGSTSFYYASNGSPLYNYVAPAGHRDGCHGWRDFIESRGYSVQTNGNFNQYIVEEGLTYGFSFSQYCAEIDAGRPVLIQVTDHTMLGYGYDTATSLVYLHDTWDHSQHTMTWAGSYWSGSAWLDHYGVTVMRLQAAADNPPTVTITSPSDGDHTRDHYITVSGTASDDNTVSKVHVQINGGGWYLCTGTTSWSRYIELAMGDNQIDARSKDNAGQWSTIQTIHVYRWSGADVCVVDDDIGGSYESYYTNALTAMGASYSVWDVNTQGRIPLAGLAQFTGPGKCVVWFTGNDMSTTLTSPDQTSLGSFLDAGGRLFLTGQDIGWDIRADAGNFYGNYLKASYVQDDTNILTIAGDANEPMTSYWSGGTTFAISGGTGASNQSYPSEIDPLTGATTILTYQATTAPPPMLPLAMGPPAPGKGTGIGARSINSSGTAGQKVKTSLYKLVYFAFGYEAIGGVNSRNRMMDKVCEWLMNAAPTQPTVSITPSRPSTNDDLHCNASGSTDADGDPITYKYQWYKNCVIRPARVWPTVSSSRTSPGDHWSCRVTPNDGIEDGPYDEAWVTINMPPTAPTVSIAPANPHDGDDLTCSASGSTDLDGDPITYNYQWYKNGVLKPARVWPTVSSSRTSPGDTWRCVVTPNDGIDDGATGEDSVVIYGAPSMPTVTITPANPYTYNDLTCNASGSVDPGGQPVTYSYQWYKNGVLKPARVWPTVSSSRTSSGDVWRCVVTPNNGTADGPPGEDTVTIVNRPPTKPTVSISPIPACTNEDLHCNASGSTDPDGDSVTYQYQWYKDGVIRPARVYPNVSSSRTSAGEVWKCVVTPTDGMDDGPSASFSVTIQSCASAVVIGALSVQPTAVGAEVVFSLSADASVTAEMLNIAGRPVAMLVSDREMTKGANTLAWNGRNSAGLAVPSGVYLVRLKAADASGGKCQVLGTVSISR